MSKFTADLSKFARKAQVTLDQAFRAVIIELFSSVITDTPVDTGRARGNWLVSVNTFPTTAVERLDPSGAVSSGAVRAEQYNIKDKVFLTNNLPYIHRLEYDGYSRQAPDGMVRKNMARVQQIVARAARKAR